MKNIAIDTCAYAAFKLGKVEVVEAIRSAQNVALCVVVLGEILSGFSVGRKKDKNQRELNLFIDCYNVSIVGIDIITVDHYVSIYAELRRKGRPIPTNDMWIAASAMQHRFAVLTLDKHFQEVDGLLLSKCFY